MTVWRSTLLGRMMRNCAGVANHRTDWDRSIFETGIAAHDVLHQVGVATNKKRRTLNEGEVHEIAKATCAALIGRGRSFEGEAEPPLNAERVFVGRDIALNYLWLEPLEPGAEYEVKMSADADWNPTAKGERPRWTGISDKMRRETIPGEEWEEDTLTITDYKTSWSTGAAWLDSTQANLYALLALARCGESIPNVLRLEVVNLRTTRTYHRELRFPGDLDEIESWREDLETTVEALEAQQEDGGFRYSPGAGCVGCPAVLQCPAAAALGDALPDNPEDAAVAYTVALSRSKALADQLRQWASEEPIAVPGGTVGYQAKEYRVLRELAYQGIADEWDTRHGTIPEGLLDAAPPELARAVRSRKLALRNLLTAMGPGFGVKAVEQIARVLHPGDGEAQRAWIGEQLETKTRDQFGIQKEGIT